MRYIFFIFLFSVLVFRSEKCNAQSDAKTGYRISTDAGNLVFSQFDTLADGTIYIAPVRTFADTASMTEFVTGQKVAKRQKVNEWAAMKTRDSIAVVRLNALGAGFGAPGFIRRDVSPPLPESGKMDASEPEPEADVLAVTRYRVVWVRDADTYWIQTPTGILKVRPVGFDADEIKGDGKHLKQSQPFGEFERDTLRAMLTGDSIDIRVLGFDVYGRTLVVATWRGIDIATLMIRNGWADYLTTSHLTATQRKALQTERDKAKRAKRGRWQNKEVVTPRKWRKEYKV